MTAQTRNAMYHDGRGDEKRVVSYQREETNCAEPRGYTGNELRGLRA
jgi:hypothetical protein